MAISSAEPSVPVLKKEGESGVRKRYQQKQCAKIGRGVSRSRIELCLCIIQVQLTQIESVFRSLKSELSIRPIGHQLEHRADAHVLIAFLAYSLQVTLKNRLLLHAPGLTPAAVFEKLATIQMVEVWIPIVDGRWLVMPRHTQPEPDVQALLNQIRIALPSQPPPRSKAAHIRSQ